MTWMDVLISAVDTLTDLVLTAVIPYVFVVIGKKLKNDKVKDYMELAEKYLISAVGMVKQTFVDSLKAEGKFDKEAQKVAFEMAKDAWLGMMNEEMKTIVLKEIGDFETWAAARLEAAVVEMKR